MASGRRRGTGCRREGGGAGGEVINVVLPSGLVVPDIVVADAAATATDEAGIDAEAVLLVVELVPPGTRTMDRRLKPLLYAEAGIASYWRVEPDPAPRLVITELGGGRYDSASWRHHPYAEPVALRGRPRRAGPAGCHRGVSPARGTGRRRVDSSHIPGRSCRFLARWPRSSGSVRQRPRWWERGVG
ncbi:Uma2 family endonuclease [Streptomyces sp. NPDC002574]|uniref:Uma2 family endonuclease n=1 Tax=Streptomyces sp. NPDC002574 TaxID=3364652 RepID=UPI00369DC752